MSSLVRSTYYLNVISIRCTIKCNTMTVIWNTENVLKLIEDNRNIDLETILGDNLGQSKLLDFEFQFGMQYSYSDGLVKINYKSPTTVHLKSTICSLYNEIYRERELEVKENYTLQANTWNNLTTLNMCDIRRDPSSFLRYGLNLCLKLQFTFTNNVDGTLLRNDFENMFNQSLFSDMIMKSAEDIEFKVHKAVLASRSAVLKAHFEHNTTECLTNIITSPLESDVLREVLTFIYSDKAPRVDEIPEKLLAAADYYQLSRLKSLCEEVLHKKLTVENAIETLQLADLHSANTLKQMTLEFMKNGRAGLIMKTKGWAQVKSVELLRSICEHIMALVDNNVKESVI